MALGNSLGRADRFQFRSFDSAASTGPRTPGSASPRRARAIGQADRATCVGSSPGSCEKKNDPLIAGPGDDLGGTALTLADVMASVYRSFPLIQQARYENMIASGERQSALGAWDPTLQSWSLSQPLGFYQNYRNGVQLARRTWWGGYLASGYRIGRGEFQPWYKERETNEAGELSLSWVQPLLQGRAIDPQRVALFQADLAVRMAAPIVQAQILEAALEAAKAYWEWVQAGQVAKAQEELLRLADMRVDQVQTLVDEGEEKASAAIFNEQLRAERRIKVLDARRKLQQAAIQLSLYLRDDQGIPIVPADTWLPWAFPAPGALPAEDLMEEVARALTQRPELALLDLQTQEQRLDLQLANNQLLPELDFLVDGSQDMGPAATSSRDKGEFEMEAGVLASVPLPRNKARGKITSTRGKLQQIAIKRQFQMQKIEVELRKARVALEVAKQRVDAAIEAFDLAMRYLALEQRSYAEGESNLIDLNILETKAFENRLLLIDALQDWYIALAMLQNAMGIDPLDASMPVTVVTPQSPVPLVVPESINTPPRVNPPANNGTNP